MSSYFLSLGAAMCIMSVIFWYLELLPFINVMSRQDKAYTRTRNPIAQLICFLVAFITVPFRILINIPLLIPFIIDIVVTISLAGGLGFGKGVTGGVFGILMSNVISVIILLRQYGKLGGALKSART